jgi:hypothetical protein
VVLTPAVAPSAARPEHRPDEAVPDSVSAQTGSGPPRPARWRSRGPAALAALVTLAVATIFVVQIVTNSTDHTTSDTATAATRQCRTALAAAGQTLDHGTQVAKQLRIHAGLMNQMQSGNGYMPQMKYTGRSSLTAGATAAAEYEDRLAIYEPLSAKCVSNAATTQACKARVTAGNQALLHASSVVTALKRHTAVMDRWDSGQLTADQAHDQGRPSLDAGLTEAGALDQSMRNYRQPTGTC